MDDARPMKETRVIATADCETNPFKKGRSVFPFVWGFYDATQFHYFWGADCTEQFLSFLRQYDTPLVIYAHNGGKFDWTFLVRHFSGDIKIIGSRIARAFLDKHELRDSFSNIPVALKEFGNKTEIDYAIMEPIVREKKQNKALILEYLKQDCVGLYDAISQYRAEFGNSLTMAGASIKELNRVCTGRSHETIYERLSQKQDKKFRQFYYGGRVECFDAGVFDEDVNIYDVTSMYPSIMKDAAHPVSASFRTQHGSACQITEDTDFAIIDANSEGALPVRDGLHLRFPYGRRIFHATGPEIRMALFLGRLKIHSIKETVTATERVHFRSFVEQFFEKRAHAKASGDAMRSLFYKLVLNAAYGKLASNPENYDQLTITEDGEAPGELANAPEILAIKYHEDTRDGPCKCDRCFRKRSAWTLHTPLGEHNIWSRPAPNPQASLLNVATAASITAFSRAKLMEAIHNASRPFYCDTDSIICVALHNVRFNSGIGTWCHEGSGHRIAIAGKKQYCVWGDASNDPKENARREKIYGDPYVVKLASKGVRLKAHQILAVALGEQVTYTQDAPMMKLDGKQETLSRNIRNTARVETRIMEGL